MCDFKSSPNDLKYIPEDQKINQLELNKKSDRLLTDRPYILSNNGSIYLLLFNLNNTRPFGSSDSENIDSRR